MYDGVRTKAPREGDRTAVDTKSLRRLAGQLKKKEETDRSLRLASVRQQRMLPDKPMLERYEFGVRYIPAADVSGDFYDFIDVRPGALGIVLGDVSGHGVEAGIVMGMAKMTVSIYGRQTEDPKEVLALVNKELYRWLDGKTFVSLSYGVLDTESGVFRFARAGQCRPILLNPGWHVPEPQVVESRGLALGVDSGERFGQVIATIELTREPGDTFFQYTDGLVEAMNKDKEQFGEDRLEELIKRYARAPAQDQVDTIIEHLDDFTRIPEYEDDITMVVLKARDRQALTRTTRFRCGDAGASGPRTPPPGNLAPPKPPGGPESRFPDWMS